MLDVDSPSVPPVLHVRPVLRVPRLPRLPRSTWFHVASRSPPPEGTEGWVRPAFFLLSQVQHWLHATRRVLAGGAIHPSSFPAPVLPRLLGYLTTWLLSSAPPKTPLLPEKPRCRADNPAPHPALCTGIPDTLVRFSLTKKHPTQPCPQRHTLARLRPRLRKA